jgi:hypothetical protein
LPLLEGKHCDGYRFISQASYQGWGRDAEIELRITESASNRSSSYAE